MPTSAYALLILGLFGISWLFIAWCSHLPLQGCPAVRRLMKPRTPLDCPSCCPSVPFSTLPAPVRAALHHEKSYRSIPSARL
jgi:hypothetical protein